MDCSSQQFHGWPAMLSRSLRWPIVLAALPAALDPVEAQGEVGW